jgi:hypothetical protein
VVKKACQEAVAGNKPLVEVVSRLARVDVGEGAVDWQGLSKPENYLGETQAIIDGVIESTKRLLT